MRLNHLDLQVSDVHGSVRIFVEVFGLDLLSNPRSSSMAILSDGADFVLVLQRMKNDGDRYPRGFHLGFYVDTVAEVADAKGRAEAHGLEVSDVITGNRGTLIYCELPDGILVEVNARSVN